MTLPSEPLMEKAYRSLSAADRNLAAGDSETALNRAYYASFYATTAALLSEGEVVKTHAGVQGRFYRRFVDSGRIPAATAQSFTRAFQARQTSDYTVQPPASLESATALLEDVRWFVGSIAKLLGRSE